MKNYAAICHFMLQPQAAQRAASLPDYHLQATIKIQVYNFVHATALMMLYGPDMTLNSSFLPQLLRNARISAMQNIHECIRAGIPCIGAVHDFEMAEVAHRTGDDNAMRLTNYWRASLYAKALLMSFKKTE